MESMLTKPLICFEIRFDYRLAMKIFLNKVIGTLLHGPVLFLKRELSEEKFNLVLFPDDKMPSEPVTSSHCGHIEMWGRMIAQKLSFFFWRGKKYDQASILTTVFIQA